MSYAKTRMTAPSRIRTPLLILPISFSFTIIVMCLEPMFHPLRILLFPGLAIVLGVFHGFHASLVGRSLLVWNLTAALSTLIYGGLIWLCLIVLRSVSSGSRPEHPEP
jgi:hypothetical protein